MNGHLRCAATLGVLLAVGVAGPGHAQGTDDLIETVTLDPDGTSQIQFRVPQGSQAVLADDLVLREDGVQLTGLVVESVERGEVGDAAPGTTVVIAVDTSGSTRGEPLAAAIDAAGAFASQATARGVAVGLITFGDEAVLRQAPTTEPAPLLATLAGLQAGGDTAMHDAIVLAARLLLDHAGERRLLLFTDGRDEGSDNPAGVAQDVVVRTTTRLDVVALATAAQDPEALAALVAGAGGSVRTVQAVEELAGAFEAIARDLPGHHLVRWHSQHVGDEVVLDLEVTTASGVLRDSTVVTNPRFGPVGELRRVPTPELGPFGSASSRPVVLALVALLCLVAFAMLTVPRDDPRTRRVLGLLDEDRGERRRQLKDDDRRSVLADQARALAESLPRPTGHDDRVRERLELAGWNLRPAELLMLRIGASVLAAVLAGGLTRAPAFAVVGAMIGVALPSAAMSRSQRKRHDAFVEQLPDVLQLVAGSLKAGYGLLQALDTVVRESLPPVSTEFRRVVAEHRLGLPLEDALVAMAHRIGSEDLRWAVVAMNIQRRVGGNLAELLETVADTVRERARVQRQVQVLSAEGKLSAQVLTVLPFLIGGYVAIVNPEYIGRLFTDPRGQLLLGGALVTMALGIVWMRRLIRVDA